MDEVEKVMSVAGITLAMCRALYLVHDCGMCDVKELLEGEGYTADELKEIMIFIGVENE